MQDRVYSIINQIITDSGRKLTVQLSPNVSLRDDLHFDSLALATLTVMVEDEFNKDIFENGNVKTISDIFKALE